MIADGRYALGLISRKDSMGVQWPCVHGLVDSMLEFASNGDVEEFSRGRDPVSIRWERRASRVNRRRAVAAMRIDAS